MENYKYKIGDKVLLSITVPILYKGDYYLPVIKLNNTIVTIKEQLEHKRYKILECENQDFNFNEDCLEDPAKKKVELIMKDLE